MPLFAKDLKPMQDGIRHSIEHFEEMAEYVRQGGRFDLESINQFTPNSKLIAIPKMEDGQQYVRDGFHRVLSIFLHRPDGIIYDDEFVIENLTYLRMMTPNLSIRYYTPFDPRTEVRVSDFCKFRDEVDRVISEKQEDPLEFIRRNRHLYVVPKKKYHETVSTFVAHWKPHDVLIANSL